MKKKTSLWTLAGLAAATAAFLKFSGAAPVEPEEKKEDETPKEACIRWYGYLTWQQYQTKLLNLDIDFEEGRISQGVYEAKRYRLLYCRNQQKVPGF
jgi:hypothetical protein